MASVPASTVERVHVGCGPHALLEGWCNTDIRPFDGVDHVMDATEPWPFAGLTHVYAEHFLEHLHVDDAVRFLIHAHNALRPGGRLRLSTPNLSWVLRGHLAPGTEDDVERRILDTLAVNRGFYGWGHRFLWTSEMLHGMLGMLGFEDVRTQRYGESDDPVLRGIERHRNYADRDAEPCVVLVEAARGGERIEDDGGLLGWLEHEVMRHVRSGH